MFMPRSIFFDVPFKGCENTGLYHSLKCCSSSSRRVVVLGFNTVVVGPRFGESLKRYTKNYDKSKSHTTIQEIQ